MEGSRDVHEVFAVVVIYRRCFLRVVDHIHPHFLLCDCNRRHWGGGCRRSPLQILDVDSFLPAALVPHYRRHLSPPLSLLSLPPILAVALMASPAGLTAK